MLDVLVVAAHPDDAEIGVGGTLAALKQQGARIGVVDLTDGEPTPFGSPECRRQETAAASAILHLDWRDNLGLPNRSLTADLEARAKLAAVIRLTRPLLLFAHYWEDSHPDHVAASSLTDAARFWAKLTRTDLPGQPHWPSRVLYYFSIHLRLHPQPSLVFDISPTLETKLQALACYRSQFLTGRPPDQPTVLDRLRDQARYWGGLIGTAAGEPFVSREALGFRSLRDLT
jgi:bacillithiol biosynthesis deacetylase BshB1